MEEAFSPNYRTALHENLAIKIKSRSSAGQTEGFQIIPDEILNLIVKTDEIPLIKSSLYNQVYQIKSKILSTNSEGTSEPTDAVQVYVKLGLLLGILNRYLIKSDTNVFLFDLDTPDNKYRTIDGHLSVNPLVCLLPSTLQSLIDSDEGFDPPLVYNILLNVDSILEILNGFLDAQSNILLLDFFDELLTQIERVTGNINKYELQYYESTNSFTILDRNFISNQPKEGIPEFDVFGLRSIITDVNLVSQIPSGLSSMVAISAQDSPFTSTTEATGFAALNKDLFNRQEGRVTDLTKEELLKIKEEKETTYQELLKNFETEMSTLFVHINAVYRLKAFNFTDGDAAQGIYENYCAMVIGKKNDPNYNFVIPFLLGLTLDGISGIKVLNSFRINKNVLPLTYGGKAGADVAFLVTGVDHTIDTKAWRTTIKAQIYNINDNGSINEGKSYQAYWPDAVGSNINSSNTGTFPDRYSTKADNNPYNIRPIGTATNFNGVTGQKEGFRGTTSIGNFLVFDNLQNGVRAGMKNLINGYFKQNINTVRTIIAKYAPASDSNDTESYISNVVKRMQVGLVGTRYAELTDKTKLEFSGADEGNLQNRQMFRELNKAILISEGGSFATTVVDSFEISKLA